MATSPINGFKVESFKYNGLNVVICGSAAAKNIRIFGKPSSTMNANSNYTVGTISNTVLRPMDTTTAEIVTSSGLETIYIIIYPGGSIQVVPRTDRTSTGNTINLNFTYI